MDAHLSVMIFYSIGVVFSGLLFKGKAEAAFILVNIWTVYALTQMATP